MKKMFRIITPILLLFTLVTSTSCTKEDTKPVDESKLRGTILFEDHQVPIANGYCIETETGYTFAMFADKDMDTEAEFFRFIISPRYCDGEVHEIGPIPPMNYYVEYQDQRHYYVNEYVSIGDFCITQLDQNGMYSIVVDFVFEDGKVLKVNAKGTFEKGVTE